jgi:acetone carboxylase gamma subunit
MDKFKIFVNQVSQFMLSERVMYATGDNKRFFITLHAAPNYNRYIVKNMISGKEFGFNNKGKAVRFFNELLAAPQDTKEQNVQIAQQPQERHYQCSCGRKISAPGKCWVCSE